MWTDGPWLYYKLTNEPKGSGEIKTRAIAVSSLEKKNKKLNSYPFLAKNGKIQTFSTVRKSLNTHGTLSVYLLCRLLTVSCFQKNRFGEFINSWFQSN